jgi:hypothetical protein
MIAFMADRSFTWVCLGHSGGGGHVRDACGRTDLTMSNIGDVVRGKAVHGEHPEQG